MPPAPPPPRGKGLLITGIAVTAGVAVPATIAGLYCIAKDHREFADPCTRPQGFVATTFGLLVFGASIPMMIAGFRRAKAYDQWKRDNRVSVSPTTGRTALGTHTAGLRVRF